MAANKLAEPKLVDASKQIKGAVGTMMETLRPDISGELKERLIEGLATEQVRFLTAIINSKDVERYVSQLRGEENVGGTCNCGGGCGDNCGCGR